jgi:hypothetical protein
MDRELSDIELDIYNHICKHHFTYAGDHGYSTIIAVDNLIAYGLVHVVLRNNLKTWVNTSPTEIVQQRIANENRI